MKTPSTSEVALLQFIINSEAGFNILDPGGEVNIRMSVRPGDDLRVHVFESKAMGDGDETYYIII